jgi:glycosyltransferase involved in cell wall biosynthesis
MTIICLVTNDLSHDQRMDRICTTLTEAGHQLTLVGRLLPDSLDLPDRVYRQHRIRCRYNSGKRFYAEYNYRLVRELRRWPYDAICAVDLDTLLAGVRLTAGSNKKLVFDAHEWFSETPEVVKRPLIRGLWRGLGKALVPKTDARYTVGPMLAKQLEAEYGVPFATVRNAPRRRPSGVVPPPAADLPVTDRKVLLYQGMLNPGRGLETVIEALAKLPECALWLVGDGPLLGALRRCGERWKCSDRIWFAGFRPPDELPAITARAWLGLNLLDAVSPSYYFSLANKSLDYLQAGLPSVQMAFPEYVAIHEDFGCYVLLDGLAAGRLVGVITELADDDQRYAALVEGSRAGGEALSWEREAAALLRVWAAVLNVPPCTLP